MAESPPLHLPRVVDLQWAAWARRVESRSKPAAPVQLQVPWCPCRLVSPGALPATRADSCLGVLLLLLLPEKTSVQDDAAARRSGRTPSVSENKAATPLTVARPPGLPNRQPHVADLKNKT